MSLPYNKSGAIHLRTLTNVPLSRSVAMCSSLLKKSFVDLISTIGHIISYSRVKSDGSCIFASGSRDNSDGGIATVEPDDLSDRYTVLED